ncbi:MAG: DEAD/DEAH box helicase, partial [Deltaproteobacteria bacterium]|nr:DEAD/DEAH box helicase [Deltaproteobacteria bacterium]
MDVFDLRDRVVDDYASFVRSFVQIHDARTQQFVDAEMQSGVLWPQPLVQLNPAFEPGPTLDELIAADELHPLCGDIFRDKPDAHTDRGPIRFHRHQVEGIRAARAGRSYVLTTGTGSGKSLAYIVPIVDHVLRRGSGRGIQAIVVYPMNALANSQVGELEKFLCHGFPQGRPPVTFKRYTGQEREEEREAIVASPPDILLTNYVMLELLLTRPHERRLVESALRMRFLVFDELHTYRGRQGADVAMLIQRVKEATGAVNVLHVGTSATLAGGASWAEQQADVAAVARQFFGDSMEARDVIGETLRRATLGPARPDAEALRQRVQAGALPTSREAFLWDPMAVWLETTVGLHAELASDRLVRSQPLPLSGPAGLAAALASEIELPEPTCAAAIRDTLLAGYRFRDDHRRPVFAFRLHQFISKGERVYASPEPPAERHITLRGQQFVPGSDRQRVLLPLVFCRECGQEYYVVERDQRHGRNQFVSRELSERPDDDDVFGGYLLIGDGVWPVEPRDQLDRLPEGWTEARADGTRRVVSHRRDKVPEPVSVRPDGQVGGGVAGWLVPAPFLFCLRCNVEYDARQRSDYGKLATLGSEGRSSATTMLGLATIRRLRHDSTLDDVARKLLSFTDNRQDASLQAGHFNDFIEVALLRGALRRAVEDAGPAGLAADQLVGRVFDALGLPPVLYALNPEARFAAREEADRALRRVLEYHIYRDLKRGWRVSSPNLEQAGLLDIAYRSLDDLCGDDSVWTECHDALRTASARERTLCCKTLLDHMRRELAIRADVLDARQQEETQRLSQQQLIERWVLDGSEEQFEKSAIAWPRGRLPADRAIDRGVFVSARGGFG